MRMNRLRSIARDERGMSMFIVIIAMLVTSMFVAAGFAAANGDLPMSGDSKDRKATYAAAEAGLNFYSYHLNQDNDYWTKCDSVPAPNASEPNPVNQPWDGRNPTDDPRRWRTIPGSTAQYTVELLPATGTKCIPGVQTTLVDLATGTFKLRFTGRPSPTSKLRRSVVATFRRDGFLNFIYFTDFEDKDPQAYASATDRSTAQTNCGDRYRAARPSTCDEIQFITGDKIKGPFHTNDDILVCGTPEFGRNSADRVEVSGPPVGWKQNGSGCSGAPTFNGTFKAATKKLTLPDTNKDLQKAAEDGGVVYTGRTRIQFTGSTTTMRVSLNNGAWNTVALPANGVIYVKNGTSACNTQPPIRADYAESASCGNLYVSGSYATSMTLGAQNDIIVGPVPNTRSSNGDLVKVDDSDAVLGLIANNFVRVDHPVDRSSGCSNYSDTNNPVMRDVTIEAAILSLQHSFMVDNYDCGSPLGTLTVNGAIAQKYRGPVGTGSGGSASTGYVKNYNYDDRLRYRSPPFFLNPVDAAWSVIRSNEQVPAR
jgi:hypothetical protein